MGKNIKEKIFKFKNYNYYINSFNKTLASMCSHVDVPYVNVV